VDNSPVNWAPRPAIVAAAWAVAVLAAAVAVFGALSDDSMSALLFGVATVFAGAFALHGTLIRPRLTADVQGLRARTLSGTVALGWAEARVRLRTTRRLGRDSVTLEVDSEDSLVVLGWLELGEDPRDVLDVLSALRARN
jgi:hypothetical protein